jgi:hypothetical protein
LRVYKRYAMFLSKHKTKSLEGTSKEFIPILNHQYKNAIQKVRETIEEATKRYEVDATKLDSLKAMRQYLKENAMKRSKNKMVLNDMLKQNEEKLNHAAKVYYHGSKIKNQRNVQHRPLNNIDATTNIVYTRNQCHMLHYNTSVETRDATQAHTQINDIVHSISDNTTTDARNEVDSKNVEKSKTKYGPGKARPLYFLHKAPPPVIRCIDAIATHSGRIVNLKQNKAKNLVQRMEYEKYKRLHSVEKEMNKSRRQNYKRNKHLALRSSLLKTGSKIKTKHINDHNTRSKHIDRHFLNNIFTGPGVKSPSNHSNYHRGKLNIDNNNNNDDDVNSNDDMLYTILTGASCTTFKPALYKNISNKTSSAVATTSNNCVVPGRSYLKLRPSTTPSPNRRYIMDRRVSKTPSPRHRRLLTQRSSKTPLKSPIRGGLGKRRIKGAPTPRVKAQPPKCIAIETALNTALNGKVKLQLGSSIDRSECFNIDTNTLNSTNGGKLARRYVVKCKEIFIRQYWKKKHAIIVIQKFLRRWNWKKQWNVVIRSHLKVAHYAATVIQKNWRYKHLLYSVRFWNNQRRLAARKLQKWWRYYAEILKEDLEEAVMKKDKALIRKYYNFVKKTSKIFCRKHFVDMCTSIWSKQYTALYFTEEEVDDTMLELTGDTDANTPIEIEALIKWRIDTQYGG